MPILKPRDVINKQYAKNLTTKDLISQIEKKRKKINNRLKKLEETQLYQFSHAYKKIKDYIRTKYGTEYLPSVRKMKRKNKEAYLVRLSHYEESPLTVTDVRKIIRSEKESVEAKLSSIANRNIRLTWKRFETFHLLIQKLREIGAFEVYESDQLYEFAVESTLQLSQEKINKFADTYASREFQDTAAIKDFLLKWDWEAERVMEFLHYTPGRGTPYYIDVDTGELVNKKGVPVKVDLLPKNSVQGSRIKVNGEIIEHGAIYDYIIQHKEFFKNNSQGFSS